MKKIILLPGIFLICVQLVGAVPQSTNSDYYEVQKMIYVLYERTGGDIDSNLNRVNQLLARLDRSTLDRLEQDIIEFLVTGCKRNYYDDYSIFLSDREELQEFFFDLLDRYGIHPEGRLIDAIINPNVEIDYRTYGNNRFINYSRRYRDSSSGLQEKVLSRMNNLPFDHFNDYFNLFIYTIELFGENPVLLSFRNKYLIRSLSGFHVKKIYNRLKSLSYNVKNIMLKDLADNVFQLPVREWLNIGSDMLREIASFNDDRSNQDWIRKILNDITGHWRRSQEVDAQEISLLVSFINQESPGSYRTIYQEIVPYFRNNGERFIYLHGSQDNFYTRIPDLLGTLNQNRDNLNQSINIMFHFARNPGKWLPKLYTIIRKKYYSRAPGEVFTHLFQPLYQGVKNENIMRQYFLGDVFINGFLQKSHQLDMARYFLNKGFMDTVMLREKLSQEQDPQNIPNITFVTSLYLGYYTGENFNRAETLNYLNNILPELTTRIAEYLLKNFENYKLTFDQLGRILQTFERIHRDFRISYREMIALKEIYDRIKTRFRITLTSNSLSQEEKRSRLISIIGLLIKMSSILKDKEELDYVIEVLRDDIFKVGYHENNCSIIVLSEEELGNRKKDFLSLDYDLRTAAFSVEFSVEDKDNQVFLEAFLTSLYYKFYIPLIRIKGFLDQIYEYQYSGDEIGTSMERPYESVFSKLNEEGKQSSLNTLKELLNCTGYLKIESSLKLLLRHHYRELGKNLWKEPQEYQFNSNTNLWIFYYLLEDTADQYGFRPEYYYETLMDIFFKHLDSPAELAVGRQHRELQSLFRFIVYRVLNPYELKAFPFYSRDNNNEIPFNQIISPTGTLAQILSSDRVDREPINGTYRYRLLEFMRQHLDSSQLEDLKLWVDTALLLPNKQENNAGDPGKLSQYLVVKRELFNSINKQVAGVVQLDIDFLVLLLKLEKSCVEVLGFDRIEKSLINKLTVSDRVTLAFERLRLDLLEMGPITREGFQNYYEKLGPLIDSFKEIYQIKPFDPLQYALEKIFRSRGGELNRPIHLHELEQMYFILAYFENVLTAANQQAESREHFEKVIKAYSDIIEIYNHFLPFMYDLDLDFMTSNEYDIIFLMLFDREIKSALIDLKRNAHERLSPGDFEQIKDEYEKLVPYILTHNFAAIELVFKAVERENLEIFNFDRTIEYLVFNFKLLHQMRETRELNARLFVDEAFAGFSGNLDLIADVNDKVVRQYYFGDFRKKVFEGLKLPFPPTSRLEIKCVDDAIRKMVRLSLRSIPENIREHIDAVIQNPVGIFTEGFTRLKTTRGMQWMWEEIVKKVGEKLAEGNEEPDFYDKYQDFYSNAVFQPAQPSFRQDIANSYVEKFTGENDLEQQRKALFPVLESLKQAIETYGNNSSFRYFNAHRQAVVNLMRSVVLGIKLPRKTPYIAKDIYDNQVGEIGAVKAVSEEVWQDPSLFDLYDWIYDGKKSYESIDDLRGLFLGTNSLNSYFVQSVHMYVEEQEQVYVERLGELNGNTERRIHTLNSVSRSLTAFQRGDENEILRTYGLLVDLRRGHNQRVENRTRQKIETLQASDNKKKDIKDFYYLLKIDEGDVEQYAQEWRYILCVLIPFSKYLGQSTLTLNSVLGLLDNQGIFKFYFFYFYRTYNNRGLTLNKYRESYPGGNAGRVEHFFGSELGFDYFSEMYDNGTSRSYMNDRYTFKQIRNPTRQQNHIMLRRFQAHCSFKGTGSRSFKQFYRNKLGIFYEVLNEINLVVSHGPKRYLQLLYYVTHTFPYIAAFQVGQSSELNFLSRYPGDRQSSESPTPFNRLIEIWNNAPARYRCLETLDATIGSIFLLQARSVDLNRRDYIEAVAGSLDFFQQYEYIRIQLTRQRCLE